MAFQFGSDLRDADARQVARGWVIYALTGSPVQLGWVMLSFLAPTLVLSLPAGVLADRVNKKRILVLAQGVNALSTIGLAAVLATGEAAFGISWSLAC